MSLNESILAQVNSLDTTKGDLLVVSLNTALTVQQREGFHAALSPLAKRLGVELFVAECGATVEIKSRGGDLLEEQRKQTAILERMAEQQLLLIQALAEDEPEDPDAQPLTYMDGTPCR